MNKYAIGLDFGTNSCRSLIVNIENGREIASHVFNYPTGDAGVIIDKNDTNLARQNPADYIEGIEIIKNLEDIESIELKTRYFDGNVMDDIKELFTIKYHQLTEIEKYIKEENSS